MRAPFTLSLLLMLPVLVWAQHQTLFQYEADSLKISLYGHVIAGSGSISNKSWNDIRQGGRIDASQKSHLENSLNEMNLVGSQYSAGISAMFSMGNLTFRDSLFALAGIEYYNLQEFRFGKPAALLALHGNLMWEGKTLPLNQLQYNRLQYQHIYLGACKLSKTRHGNVFSGFTAGIALGTQQMNIRVDSGFLFTAPFGEYLSFYSTMQFSRSAPETVKPFRYQGAGPALGFFYHWQSDFGTQLGLAFDQLGFIRWNSNSYSYSRDTTFTFEGIVAENIFQMEPGWEKSLTPDTFDFWFNRYGNPHPHYTSLPVRMRAYGEHRFRTAPFSLLFDALWMPNSLMKPMFTGGVQWHISPALAVSRTYTWGGYSRFSSGISAEFNCLHSWKIRASARSLIPSLDKTALYNRQFEFGVVYRPAF